MSKFFVKDNQIKENKIEITGNDVNHIKNVLRLKVEDKIFICNSENQTNYECEIETIEKDVIICKIENQIKNEAESNVQIDIYQGLPKADKMELIIQKSTELGAHSFIPVSTKRSIVKLSGKDEKKKIERWQTIAEVAAKQCGRDLIPNVSGVQKVEEICSKIKQYDLFLVAYELEDKQSFKEILKQQINTKEKIKIGILIGPEGGLENTEVQKMQEFGAKVISLGKRILRTETVALSMTAIILYELEDFGGKEC